MPKRRPKREITDREVERFAEQADKGSSSELDPKAPRNYKSIAIPFNEYEFQKLEYACEQTGRSKNSLIRYLILRYVKELERGIIE